jgi:hypothetical protein
MVLEGFQNAISFNRGIVSSIASRKGEKKVLVMSLVVRHGWQMPDECHSEFPCSTSSPLGRVCSVWSLLA